MKSNKEYERLFRQEFHDTLKNVIWQDEDGDYQVFDRYTIVPEHPGYRVFCGATEVGRFGSTRTALSWCIADKYAAYNTAREILNLDIKLDALANDISVRAALGDRSRTPELKETILTKLETKIIHKKLLENRLTKCVNWAKYIQQRGFDNETARTGRNQPNKANR
jgi:hypothetical protein